MGVELAAEAARRGAHVTLLAANLAVAAPAEVEVVETPTAAELEREALARGADADVVIMAAAVADYRPATAFASKRPQDRAVWTVELEPTTDVLAAPGPASGPSRGRRRSRSRRRSWTRWKDALAEPAVAPAPSDLIAAITANLARVV